MPPFEILGEDRPGPWIVTCDHARNAVPPEIGDLGLPPDEMGRHIAYDVGALGVARVLSEALDAPMLSAAWSRLVIDVNRGEDDPTLLMRLYDGTIVPGNRAVGDAEIERRLDAYHRPYHAALAGLMERERAIIVAVHSFTPQFHGHPPRPWHVGILSAWDRRLADPLLAGLHEEPDLAVGDNEPYGGHLPGDSVDRHALCHGRPNALLEIRQDLIREEAGQRAWGERMAGQLEAARRCAGL
jgi:predicted N-formylglutamate amidohydrolase